MKSVIRRIWPVLPVSGGLAITVAIVLTVHGCGERTLPDSPLGRAAENAFGPQGYPKEVEKLKFIAMEGDPKEKIDLMVQILNNRPANWHPGATEVIAHIEHPSRIDVLGDLLDNYDGPRDIKSQVQSWAVTGLGFSAQPRAFKKLFQLLNASKDKYLLGSILHDLGVAPRNAKRLGKQIPEDLLEEIESQVEKCREHEELSVREHAERALLRLHGAGPDDM